MAFTYKPATLKKLEAWFKEAGYLIRYERGNFNAGYCILEQKRVVVINKFFDLDARLNALVDIQTQILPALRESHPELAEDAAEWIAARASIRPEFQPVAEPAEPTEAVDPADPAAAAEGGTDAIPAPQAAAMDAEAAEAELQKADS